MKKYTLTDEHRAQLKPWSERWTKNALRTDPMTGAERAQCREAVNRLYRSIDKPEPKAIVFVPSPVVLRFAAGYTAAILHLRKKGKCINFKLDTATAIDSQYVTETSTRKAVNAATSEMMNTIDPDVVERSYEATDRALHNVMREPVTDLSKWFVMNGDPSKLDKEFGLDGFGIECAKLIWNCYQGGNFWSAWDCFLTFFRHVVKLPIDYSKYDAWETLALHSSVRIVHADFCMICDFPTVLKIDDQNRPHCDDGPFCKWSDGSALYAVHGVRVPAWIIEKPDTLTVTHIQKEDNAEIRRVMIDKYGTARYMQDAGAVEIHHDDWGTLYRMDVPNDEPIVMVKMINSTPEPSGEYRVYFERVPPDMQRAKQAIAWTFGKTEEEYVPDVQT